MTELTISNPEKKYLAERIGIIGTGRLGQSLARALSEAGCDVLAVNDRDERLAKRCAFFCGEQTRYYTIPELPSNLSLIFLAVPDDAVQHVARKLTQSPAISADTIVCHSSGALSSDVLAALKPRTSLLASMHPVQTFSGADEDWKRLFGISFGLEGHPRAIERLERLVHKLRGRIVRLRKEDKGLYHLACVFASNYFVAVCAMATEIFGQIGVSEEEAIAILEPLTLASADNIKSRGTARAATGPITRGDLGTVRHHVEELEKFLPDVLPAYLALAQKLVHLAARQPGANATALDEIRRFLSDRQRTLFHASTE